MPNIIIEPTVVKYVEFSNGVTAITRGVDLKLDGTTKTETVFTKGEPEFELLQRDLNELDIKKEKGNLVITVKKSSEVTEITDII